MDANRQASRAFRLLPPAAARAIGRVASSTLPVLCLDSFGPAFERMAAAIHAESRRDRLVHVDLRASRDGLLAALIRAATSPRCTLAIDGIERLDDDAQAALLRLLDDDGEGPRLLSASLESVEALRAALRPELFALATTITVSTPALARAGSAIAGIAQARLAALAADLACAEPTLSTEAVRALAAHDWPGDAAELDGVLARTLVEIEGPVVEERDLRWGPLAPGLRTGDPLEGTRARDPGPGSPAPSRAADDAHDASSGVGSEAIALELAHRIKNPLVTVRTFVQSVAQLASDPADLARFRDLTEEAIERMDEALEDILAFSRLGPAEPDALEIIRLLREALADARASHPGEGGEIELRADARLVAVVDEPRLRAALAAVARHVFETLEPRGVVSVEVLPDGFVLRHPEGGAASHLRGVTGLDEELPLSLLLARGALVHAGASLASRDEGGLRRIEVRFPGAEADRAPGRAGSDPGHRDGTRRDA